MLIFKQRRALRWRCYISFCIWQWVILTDQREILESDIVLTAALNILTINATIISYSTAQVATDVLLLR